MTQQFSLLLLDEYCNVLVTCPRWRRTNASRPPFSPTAWNKRGCCVWQVRRRSSEEATTTRCDGLTKGELWCFPVWAPLPVVSGGEDATAKAKSRRIFVLWWKKGTFHVHSFSVRPKNTHVLHSVNPLRVFAITSSHISTKDVGGIR